MELTCLTPQARDILGVICEQGIENLEDKIADEPYSPYLEMWQHQIRVLKELEQAVDQAIECEFQKDPDMTWEMDRMGNVTIEAKGKSFYLQGDEATRFIVSQLVVPENIGPGDGDNVFQADAEAYYHLLEDE